MGSQCQPGTWRWRRRRRWLPKDPVAVVSWPAQAGHPRLRLMVTRPALVRPACRSGVMAGRQAGPLSHVRSLGGATDPFRPSSVRLVAVVSCPAPAGHPRLRLRGDPSSPRPSGLSQWCHGRRRPATHVFASRVTRPALVRPACRSGVMAGAGRPPTSSLAGDRPALVRPACRSGVMAGAGRPPTSSLEGDPSSPRPSGLSQWCHVQHRRAIYVFACG